MLQRSGYGDLWDDIQNVPETNGGDNVCGMSASSEEAGGSYQCSETERKEDSFCWKSEEEENWIKEDSLDAEDEEEEENRGTVCSCECCAAMKPILLLVYVWFGLECMSVQSLIPMLVFIKLTKAPKNRILRTSWVFS